MLRFLWNRSQAPSSEKEKLQKEVFAFSKNVPFGFPHKPTDLDWDPVLRLLVIVTRGGSIRVFGQPGVELAGQLEEKENRMMMRRVLFLPGQGRLVTLSGPEQVLHFWEIEDGRIERVKTTVLDCIPTTITALAVDTNRNVLFIGSKAGTIHQLHLWSFILDKEVISHEQLLANIPEAHQEEPGEVVMVAMNPFLEEQVLVAFSCGFMLLWSTNSRSVLNILKCPQQLEGVCWRSEDEFFSAHADGSFTVWDAETGAQVQAAHTPYGPYPCRPIRRLYCREAADRWCVFSGGMPRSTHGDRFTVTVMKEDEDHMTYELSSRVVTFQVVEAEGEPECLVILTEEEAVFIDLASKGWPVFQPPYLHSIHASAITCLSEVCDVHPDLLARLETHSPGPPSPTYVLPSQRGWPVDGGEAQPPAAAPPSLILTGHEDGKVKVWLSRANSLALLTALDTARYFLAEEGEDRSDAMDEWPPFRRVGSFDPFSDDPRFAIKTVELCPTSGLLLVGGIAGQLLFCRLECKKEYDVPVTDVDLMVDDDTFEWKGQESLGIRACQFQHPRGFQPQHILQVEPPSAITSLAVSFAWGLVTAGTAFGFVIFDTKCHRVVLTKATVNQPEVAEEAPLLLPSNKSLTNSLRESFNKIRRSHTHRCNEKKRLLYSQASQDIPELELLPPESCLPERRAIPEDGSLVRSLRFACTFIETPDSTSPTLWVGTNRGHVMAFLLSVPEEEGRRRSEGVEAVLAKEIQLKHMAPVIDIEVLDSRGARVAADCAVATDTPHKVLIMSEEQFKIFSLPTLNPTGKYKVTANEGVVVRRTRATTLESLGNPELSDHCLLFLSSLGEISAFSLPELKCQMKVAAVRSDNHVGISSFVFSNTGRGLYMSTCNELQEISVSAADGCSSPGGRVPVRVARGPADGSYNEIEVKERCNISPTTTIHLIHDDDTEYSEMTTSMNSDASNDMDLVRHHDVGTSCCNLLDPIPSSEEDSDSEPGEVEEVIGRGRRTKAPDQPLVEADPMSAWLGVSWLIMYLMFILFLLYKRKPGPVQ